MGSPSIRIYVVASGGPSEALDHVADAGQTVRAYDITAGMQSFREAVLPCDFAATPQELADGFYVELVKSDKRHERYDKVRSLADCSPALGPSEWYPDPITATRIHLCPWTCEEARAAPGATLDTVVPCETTTQ